MLRIDDMFMISKSKVASFFLDDIQEFFDEKEIYYSDNVQFTGISGFAHNYDFLLQRSRTKPERLCQAVNNPNKSSMGNILFAWNDTKPARKNGSQLIVILNDQNNIAKGVSGTVRIIWNCSLRLDNQLFTRNITIFYEKKYAVYISTEVNTKGEERISVPRFLLSIA